MIIGVDVSMLVYTGSGVANYTYNLVKNLLTYDKKKEYRLFYSSLRRPENFYYLSELRKLGAKIYDYRFPPTLLEIWWGKFHVMPVEWFIGKVDVFFTSDFLRPPLLKGTKAITTIHDLTWKIFPQYHEERIVKAHEKKLEKTIKYKDTIIVDSLNTKDDLLRFYPQINKKNVYVIYPAVGDQFKKINNKEKIKKVLEKYSVTYPSNFLLYVGAIEPRKNLETAIRVFHRLITHHSSLITHFLIVGRMGWKNEKVHQLVKDLHLENKVKFIGYVEDEDLPYFYNAAKVFIYLSKYEGFGLPPSEAAACGTPSLLYNNSSLKEIFLDSYPFTKKGQELENLINLINKKPDMNLFTKDFSWASYCEKFDKIIK